MAGENDAEIEVTLADVVGTDAGWDVVLAGDVFYDRAMADLLTPWFQQLAGRGAAVIVGDPGRAYCPKQEMTLMATYMVPVTRALEDSEVKRTSVWRFGS